MKRDEMPLMAAWNGSAEADVECLRCYDLGEDFDFPDDVEPIAEPPAPTPASIDLNNQGARMTATPGESDLSSRGPVETGAATTD
jgi:hypothetical protein